MKSKTRINDINQKRENNSGRGAKIIKNHENTKKEIKNKKQRKLEELINSNILEIKEKESVKTKKNPSENNIKHPSGKSEFDSTKENSNDIYKQKVKNLDEIDDLMNIDDLVIDERNKQKKNLADKHSLDIIQKDLNEKNKDLDPKEIFDHLPKIINERDLDSFMKNAHIYSKFNHNLFRDTAEQFTGIIVNTKTNNDTYNDEKIQKILWNLDEVIIIY